MTTKFTQEFLARDLIKIILEIIFLKKKVNIPIFLKKGEVLFSQDTIKNDISLLLWF